ncbi:TraB/GumN family protein [Candidatus Woesearchaeota archaeon]|nr:TraB/GumN family protein [Candidatus Woesearchaeota archaeon]
MTTFTFENLSLIGTSHISKESLNEVKDFIAYKKPDILAVELDHLRLDALLNPEKKKISVSDIKHIGFKGFLFNLIGALIQKRLGKLVGVNPGSEMLIAINLAKENKIELHLVDQNIRITLKRLSQLITFKEKVRLFLDFIKSPFINKVENVDFSKIDLTKVHEDKFIAIILNLLKKRYPSFYKALIEERNKVIAKNLNRLIKDNPNKKILAIVGAGHIPGLIKIIKSG